jgi:hypothetical protein
MIFDYSYPHWVPPTTSATAERGAPRPVGAHRVHVEAVGHVKVECCLNCGKAGVEPLFATRQFWRKRRSRIVHLIHLIHLQLERWADGVFPAVDEDTG